MRREVSQGREKRERITIIPFIWVLFGMVVCIMSGQLGIGKVSSPGAGFVPFLTGLIVVVLGAALFLHGQFFSSYKQESGRVTWREMLRVLLIASMLIAYSLLLPFLGFILATLLLLFLTTGLIGSVNSIKAIVISTVISVALWLVFVVVLDMQMPRGMVF